MARFSKTDKTKDRTEGLDEIYTNPHAVTAFLDKYSFVLEKVFEKLGWQKQFYEPCDARDNEGGGNITKELRRLGYVVHTSDIQTGTPLSEWKPTFGNGIIFTNTPFLDKSDIIRLIKASAMPYIVYFTLDAIGQINFSAHLKDDPNLFVVVLNGSASKVNPICKDGSFYPIKHCGWICGNFPEGTWDEVTSQRLAFLF